MSDEITLNSGPESRSSRSIQEVRIDFFLEEEFSSDPEFARQFLAACNTDLTFHRVERIHQSLLDKFGEADVAVVILVSRPAGGNNRLALLIENKITAAFQPRQAERYQERGNYGMETGEWDKFLTVLVAPRAYIADSNGFNASLALEQLEDWICPNDSARRAYKIGKIREAIEKKNTTGVKVVDAEMTMFRKAYYQFLQAFNDEHNTDFGMRLPKDTYYGDYWFQLKSSTLPAPSELKHMPYTGIVEMTFKDTDCARASVLADLIECDMKLLSTGSYKQHTTIRLCAPTITSFDNFGRDEESVRLGLLGALRLLRMYQRKSARINETVAAARLAQEPFSRVGPR
jgi:hypothetical protein